MIFGQNSNPLLLMANRDPLSEYGEIRKSVRFRASAGSYITRTTVSGSAGNIWTFSTWFKRGSISSLMTLFDSGVYNTNRTKITLLATDAIEIFHGISSTTNCLLVSNALLRDPSAWYHLVVTRNGANYYVYINGVLQTMSVTTTPTSNTDLVGGIGTSRFGNVIPGASNQFFDGYIADAQLIIGQGLDASYFGLIHPITRQWRPKKYSGSYGTNGFHLEFLDGTNTTTLCYDSSPNAIHWSSNGVSLTLGSSYDWMDDTPTNNFAVLNPMDVTWGAVNRTFSDGNLALTSTSQNALSTFAVSTGKWFFEAQSFSTISSSVGVIGLYYRSDGTKSLDGGVTWTAYGASFGNGDIIGCAVDFDVGTLEFFKNNTSQGVISAPILSSAAHPFFVGTTGTAMVWIVNFGQRPFTYSPPTGFKMLCSKNLQKPGPVALEPRKHFTIYTRVGNGTTQTLTGLKFSPGLIWTKGRDAAWNNVLFDSIRGANKFLYSNSTAAEATSSGCSFNSNGYTLGLSSEVNNNANSYVDWIFNAGDNLVTNNDGTISSQVMVNKSAGFSIISYTGTGANGTLGHGLGIVPKLVIVKGRSTLSSTSNWIVYHVAQNASPQNGRLLLNTSDAYIADSQFWNNTAPNSTVINLGANNYSNELSKQFIAYCFAEVEGYSKIGSYTGNALANGPFIYCGFRPMFVLIKRSDNVGSWHIHDTQRATYNLDNKQLLADSNAIETAADQAIDILSNGFKIRTTGSGVNASGGTYLFMAFAEFPLRYANAR